MSDLSWKKASFSRWGITTQLPGKTFRPGEEEGPFLLPNFAKSFTCTTTKATSFSAASLFFPLEAPSLHPSLGGQTHFSKYRRERRQKKMETLSSLVFFPMYILESSEFRIRQCHRLFGNRCWHKFFHPVAWWYPWQLNQRCLEAHSVYARELSNLPKLPRRKCILVSLFCI